MNSMESVTERGYGKINLHLDITGRMERGYHRVATVMQTVSIYDEVTVRRVGEGLTLTCDDFRVPTDGRNLAIRAAIAFFDEIGQPACAAIHIVKRIPMAAGMAGGSADAAATLRALNRLYGEPLSVERLCSIGSCLGADVPFCIVGGCAYADGKGDVLHSFPPMPECTLVIACEGEGVSTPWAYGLLDRLYDDFTENSTYRPRPVDVLRSGMEQGKTEEVAASLYNIFDGPILAERPVAATVKTTLLNNGAQGAMMSGSGPSVFGIFCNETEAQHAADSLTAKGFHPYLCHPVRS